MSINNIIRNKNIKLIVLCAYPNKRKKEKKRA